MTVSDRERLEPPTFRPHSLRELEQLVAWAVAEVRPLEIKGGGTKRRLGRPVEAQSVVDTTKLSGIDMYEPHELVMSAGAGTPLREIEAAIAERGQRLEFEPPDCAAIFGGEVGQQTIGGVFACNLAGPRRLKSGAARDHLLGLQIVTGHAQVIKSGGRVVKNVTGYDLAKLLTGSYGTLAVLSHLTFKVLPATEEVATLVLAGDEEATLLASLRKAMASAHDVSSAALLPHDVLARSSVETIRSAGRSLACLRLEGTSASIKARIEGLEKELRQDGLEASRLEREASLTLWREIRDVSLLDPASPCLWRLSLPPSEAPTVAGKLEGKRLFDHAGGLIWLATDEPASDCIRGALSAGGIATLIRAPAGSSDTHPPFQPQPEALRQLSMRVKKSFDPKKILNPGRMYEGI